MYQVLVLTILSLSAMSLILTTTSTTLPDYANAQVSVSQNIATADGVPSTTSVSMNITNPPTTVTGENQAATTKVRILIEQARLALQNKDFQGALMTLNSALDALEGLGDVGQNNNMTNTPNEITDGSTATTEAGTIGSGGAGGAGTAGGIITSNQTTTEAGTIGSGGAGGAGTAGGIMTGSGGT